MAWQQLNLLTKTVTRSNPQDMDEEVAKFQKDHKVDFSQSHVTLGVDGKLYYTIVMFYRLPSDDKK